MCKSICTVKEFADTMLIAFPKFNLNISHFADCSEQIKGALIYAIDREKYSIFLRNFGYAAPTIKNDNPESIARFNTWLYFQSPNVAYYADCYIIQLASESINFGLFKETVYNSTIYKKDCPDSVKRVSFNMLLNRIKHSNKK